MLCPCILLLGNLFDRILAILDTEQKYWTVRYALAYHSPVKKEFYRSGPEK